MAVIDAPPAGHAPATTARMRWPSVLVLHLAPAAATFAAALLLAPLVARLGLPRGFALTAAFAFVLTPIELGLLLRAAHRATGRWSLQAVPEVLAYRRPLGRWWRLVPVMFAVALAIAVAWQPVGNALGAPLAGLFPDWMLPTYDETVGFPRAAVVAVLLVSLLIDGTISPIVEELYFRGYLLPRLPLAGWQAVPVSAALFAVQHYWQPYNWMLIFVLEVLLTTLVRRSRSFRFGMVMHVLANCFGILVTLISVLS
ncbi:MAG TPA: CPBP family intramembrane glutamic endopeptidase [Rugosimonospora sp.]|jgi:hypothetical protein